MSSDLAPYIYLLAPTLGWFSAHIIKFAFTFITSKGRDRSLVVFVRSGGMPSSHTAVLVSLLVVVGAHHGIESALFGIVATITAIVAYDALNVRQSVGQQGDVLKKVTATLKLEDHFFVAYGHTLIEVICGGIVGFLVGFVLLQIL